MAACVPFRMCYDPSEVPTLVSNCAKSAWIVQWLAPPSFVLLLIDGPLLFPIFESLYLLTGGCFLVVIVNRFPRLEYGVLGEILGVLCLPIVEVSFGVFVLMGKLFPLL